MSGLRNLIPPPTFIAAATLTWFGFQYEASWQFVLPQTSNTETKSTSARANNTTQLPALMDGDISAEQLARATARPLFSQTRRPPEIAKPVVQEVIIPEPTPEPVPQVPIRPANPNIQFLGIIRSGQSTSALVRDLDANSEAWAVEGDQIGQWQVVTISEHSVTLTSGVYEFSVNINQ